MNRQRGALTFITPIIMVIIIMLGVLATDGARLYSMRQELQSQVNAAATAAADATQACGSLSFNESVSERAFDGAVASGFEGGQSDLNVSTGKVISENDTLRFVEKSNHLESNAVSVSYVRSEPISILLPTSVFGTVDISVSAVAKKSVEATFSAAGITAVVGGDPNNATILNSLLGLLLNDGAPYSLSTVQLSEINDLTVRLGDLLVDTGVGGVVNALPVDARGLAEALKATIGAAHPAGDLVDDLIRTAGADLGAIQVGSVLELLGDGAAASRDARVPVYDLLVSMAMNVLEGTLTEPVDLGINLNGLAEVELSLLVAEAPKVVMGEALLSEGGSVANIDDWTTTFQSSNVKLFLNVDLLSGLGRLASVSLPLIVETGYGEGAFTAADCARGGTDNTVDLAVDWNTSVAQIRTAQLNSDGSEAPADLEVTILLINVPLKLEVDIESDGGGASPTVFEDMSLYKGGDGFVTAQKGVGGRIEGIDINLSTDAGGLIGAVLSILNPLLDLVNALVLEPLVQLVLAPLLDVLGLDTGSMNIRVTDANQKVVLLEGVEVE